MIKVFTITILFTGFLTAQEPAELATFNQVMKIMDEHYYDSKFSGLNWKELSEKTREEIKQASSASARYKLIIKQLKQLNHSHLEFHPPVHHITISDLVFGNPVFSRGIRSNFLITENILF